MSKSKKENIEWKDFKERKNITIQRAVFIGDYFVSFVFVFSGLIDREFNQEESDIASVKLNKKELFRWNKRKKI